MRKEAKVGIFSALIIIALIVNIDNIFNTLTSFFLTGLIPGTQLAIPSLIMFSIAILALSTMIVRVIRKHLPKKYVIKLVRGRAIQIDGKRISSYSV